MQAAPAAAAAYGTEFSPLAQADPPATQHTVARRKSGAQGGGTSKRSRFTPTSLLTPVEVVAKHRETTHKLHLTQTRENRAKETLQKTQMQLDIEQQRRVVAEAELAEREQAYFEADKANFPLKNYHPEDGKAFRHDDSDHMMKCAGTTGERSHKHSPTTTNNQYS